MRHRLFFLSLAIPIFLPLVACSGGPPTSPGEKYLSDARNRLSLADSNLAWPECVSRGHLTGSTKLDALLALARPSGRRVWVMLVAWRA